MNNTNKPQETYPSNNLIKTIRVELENINYESSQNLPNIENIRVSVLRIKIMINMYLYRINHHIPIKD